MITRARSTNASARRPRRAVAAVLALGVLVPVGVAATTAAWTDDATFSAPVSAADTWTTEPDAPFTCEVLRVSDGSPTGDPCTVTSVTGDPVDDGQPVGERWQKVWVALQPVGWIPDVVVRLTLDLSAVSEVPQDWVWQGAFYTPVNLVDHTTLPWASAPHCDDLPVATLYLFNYQLGQGAGAAEFDLHEAGEREFDSSYCVR